MILRTGTDITCEVFHNNDHNGDGHNHCICPSDYNTNLYRQYNSWLILKWQYEGSFHYTFLRHHSA